MVLSLGTGLPQLARAEGISEVYELIESGNFADARSQINTLINKSPNDPELLFARAVIEEKNGASKKAIKYYRELTKSHPDLLEPYNNLAIYHAETGNYQEAIKTLEQAMQANPAVATAYRNLTAIYAQMASAAYRKALNSTVSPEPLRLSSLDKIESLQFLPIQERPTLVASVNNFIAEALEDNTTDIAKQTKTADSTSTPEVVAEVVAEPEAQVNLETSSDVAAVVQPETTQVVTTEPLLTESVNTPEQPAKPEVEIATNGSDAQIAITSTPSGNQPVVVAAVTPSAEARQAAEDGAAQKQALIDHVKSWAEAWSSQDVTRYLAHYSDGFIPRNNLTLAEWRVQRNGRLKWREFIIVKPSKYSINLQKDKATVNFTQYYKSERLEDTIRKTLELEKRNGDWLIVQELI